MVKVGAYRIGMDARPLSTRISGVGRLLSETLKAFPHSEEYHFFLFSHLPIHADYKTLLSLSNITVIPNGNIFRWKGGFYYNLFLPFFLRWFELDLFWGSQQVLPPFLPRRLAAVLTYCDLVLYLYPNTMRPLARFQQKLFQKYSVFRSSYILSISKQTSDDMCSFFGFDSLKTGISYPGVNKKEIESLLKQPTSQRVVDLDTGYILSVSTIEPRKNYPFLLKVYQEYRRKNPKNHRDWVIVGKIGWESQEFIEEIRAEQSLFADIHILDSIGDSDLQHIYKNAGLFIFASRYEGFGIPMLEALFHKKYCIVSDIPTFKEIGGEGVTYLSCTEQSDELIWADKIFKFFQNPKDPSSNIDKFTWAHTAKITEEIFRKVLNE